MEASSYGPGARKGSRRQKPAYHYVDGARKWASVSLLLVSVLLLIAVDGPWWQTEVSSLPSGSDTPNGYVELSFDLGGAISCTSYNESTPGISTTFSPCQNFSTHQYGGSGALYSGMNDGLIGLLGASAVSWLLATLGNLGVRFGRLQLTIEIGLVLAVTLIALGFVVGAAVLSPEPQASTYCWALSGNTTTCPFFWGSSNAAANPVGCISCGTTFEWGGGSSFYETLLVVPFGAVTSWSLWRGRRGPYTREENVTWAASNTPYSLRPTQPTRLAGAEAREALVPAQRGTRPAVLDPRHASSSTAARATQTRTFLHRREGACERAHHLRAGQVSRSADPRVREGFSNPDFRWSTPRVGARS